MYYCCMMCLTFSGSAIISFVSATYTVGENDGTLMVCAQITGLPSGALGSTQITGLPSGALGSDVTVQTSFLDGNLASKLVFLCIY